MRFHELAKSVPKQELNEENGSRIITPTNNIWNIFQNEKYRVRASALKHSVPCWGWIVEELPRQSKKKKIIK